MSVTTKFPLGTYVGNPNGNDPAAEATFERQFNSFVAAMGAKPQFMDGFVDPSQDPSQWASNASWTAWSWASSPVVGTSITPVIGVPMAANNSWNNQDQFFHGIISGKYDADYKGVIDAWAQNGYKTVYFRLGYEMDGSFMPWFMGNDAQTQADWVAAFQHLSTLMKQQGLADGVNVKIVWNPTDINWTSANVASLYPGDQYVDVVGTDVYSPQYPLDLTNWAVGGTTQSATFAEWAASAVNREHFWTYPSANYWSPNGQTGVGWSVQDTINLALAHQKPIGIAETGAGGNGTTNGPVDDPAFPAWLAGELSQAGAPQIAFVNIWDAALSDGNWDFTSPAASKPNEAAAWAKYFGAGSGTGSVLNGGTVGSGADKLVLNISEDRYANGDGRSDANGDSRFIVLVDGKQIGGTLTVTAMHSQGQTERFTFLGNFGPGNHLVEARLTNDAWSGVSTPTTDRNIYVDGVTYRGAAIAYTGEDVNGSGSWFTISGGTSPPASDTLVLNLSADLWQGSPQFLVSVDGKQLGGARSVTAVHSAGQVQAFDFKGAFGAGLHDVAISFINDAYGGTPQTDRNLYVNSIVYDGVPDNPVPSGVLAALYSDGTVHFTVGTA